ncbi:protein kinase domain-containing protein [Xylanimonas sp. McL0601]|uniref:serine/threonine-protein kinase n=1 Tax=Xylanimonas sp. McL0601 TaxID=3414739 RepID=UPI003CF50A28
MPGFEQSTPTPTGVVDPGPVPPPPPPSAAPVALAATVPPAAPVRTIPATGAKVGPFTVGEALGHGGFAHVYRAVDDDGTEVALKVLTSQYDGARERFALEARLLEKVGGRGFPRLLQTGLGEAQPWFAMELVPGRTLSDHVREAGPLDARRALRLADQLVSALRVLQEQQCIHRDLKPANIMIDGDRAVLIDLGVAKVFDAATSTQPAGTLAYMAPELFTRRVHPRSDVYSLGLLLVFASTGSLPPDLNFLGRDVHAEDLVEVAPGDVRTLALSPAIDRHVLGLVLAMTRYRPDHRPALESLTQVLRARLAGEADDGTLLLTDTIVGGGLTAAEQALGPVAGLTFDLHAYAGRPTKIMVRPGTEAKAAAAAATATAPWHALVYDATLMSVLCELHDDGFDGAAEQVIADHVASIGAQVAHGSTPAQIKDWIWQAMRWQAAAPPGGYPDSLRGWRAYRNPQSAPPPARPAGAPRRGPVLPSPTQVLRGPDAAATVVARLAPPSYRPRTSPVKHLGPSPQPPSVQAAGPATMRGPAPALGQPPTVAQPPAGFGDPTRPYPTPERPAATEPQAPSARRRRWPMRACGALLRTVPRLLALAAVAGTVLMFQVGPVQRGEPMLDLPRELLRAIHVPPDQAGVVDAPLLAVAALVVAALLRAAGHRMRLSFYVFVALVTIGAAAVVAVTGV